MLVTLPRKINASMPNQTSNSINPQEPEYLTIQGPLNKTVATKKSESFFISVEISDKDGQYETDEQTRFS
jgi:hypothetical protein